MLPCRSVHAWFALSVGLMLAGGLACAADPVLAPAPFATAATAPAPITTSPLANDPYAAWMQGRPQEAVPALVDRAEADQRWSSWYDCGLAAGAAGDDRAAAWLLAAHHRAPLRAEPLAALRALDPDAPLAPTWSERLGPATVPASGWFVVVLLAIGGLGIGWAAAAPRRRNLGITAAVVVGIVVAPGLVASWHDGRDGLVATLRDTSLVDSTGAPQATIAGGTVLLRENAAPWSGRVLVHSADGHRGWIPVVDVGGD